MKTNTKIALVAAGLLAGSVLYITKPLRETNPPLSKQIESPYRTNSSLESSVNKKQIPNRIRADKLGTFFVDSTDEDLQFLHEVKPAISNFLSRLKSINASPIDPALSTNTVSHVRFGQNAYGGTNCSFIIDDSWTVRYDHMNPSANTTAFDGITYFGPRGRDNPYKAISRADTNTLARIADNIKFYMPQETAIQLIPSIFNALGENPQNYEQPQIKADKPFGYNIGTFTAVYRTKGSDPLNQLDGRKTLTITPSSTNQAALTLYLDTSSGLRR